MGQKKGYKQSFEHAEKRAAANRGKKRSDETISKIKAARKLQVFTLEQRQKQSERSMGEGNPFFGKKHTEESLQKMSEWQIGRIPWNKGKTDIYSEETLQKMSEWQIGRFTGENNPNYGNHCSEEVKKIISAANLGKIPWHKGKSCPELAGENNPNWKGGFKIANARSHNKRRERGFILITDKNIYDEPIEYHHIDPKLPYVVPCPTRIHKMFPGNLPTHYDLVNAMLGFKFDGVNICL